MSLKLGNYEVKDNFFVVSIGGTNDAVLDIQWLLSLVEITLNLQTMELKFMSEGNRVVLRGMSNGGPQIVSLKRMERLVRHDQVDKSWKEHLQHLDEVLSILESESLFAKESKSDFGMELLYLGHIISAKGVKVDPKKIKAIVDWPPPENLTHLKGFLGLCGFYRRFVKGYSQLAALHMDLTKEFLYGQKRYKDFLTSSRKS
ncbi:uncharacterized protein LOC131068974 [Cryptomeria japonica]|uniref:uncharacterized protein LOC131068974 n=1 Tax=Cryptomeria japonica TaxID=3369 RepID=UPI0027DA94C0|nr:uncharacterized protein LOC131068974 [Cryptomeria japonica]